MRRVLVAALSAVLAFSWLTAVRADEAEGVTFETGTFAEALAAAKASGRPLFVDFFTRSCGWCRVLERDVFSRADIGATMKAFVNVRIDAEAGEGVELAKRFRLRGYPSLVVLDGAGVEIDRITGYEPAEAFDRDMKRILRGEGTIADVRNRRAKAPSDVALTLELGEKLFSADPPAAEKLFDAVIASKKSGADEIARARLGRTQLLTDTKRWDAAFAEAETLFAMKTPAAQFPMVLSAVYGSVHGGASPERALVFLDAALAKANDTKSPMAVVSVAYSRMDVHLRAVVDALRLRVAAAAKLPKDDPNAWSCHENAAWTCLSLRRNVKEATLWARTAVEASGEAASTLDTLAQLLWLTCEHEEAYAMETRAAEKAEGNAKCEYVGTLAKWKAQLDMGIGALEYDVADDNYAGVQGPCGK